MNRMTKKAALGDPSSDETFPCLGRKSSSKFYCWQQLATRDNFMIYTFNSALLEP